MVAPGGYDAIVAAASRKYGVPEATIRAVMQTESSNRPDAVSPKGAAGLMQLMAPTYQEIAKREGLGSDRFDPTSNIYAGTAYLRQNFDQFGNWRDALGAYNAGPGRWSDVKAGRASVPAETRNYIPKVQAGAGEQGAVVNFNDVLNRYAGTMRPSAALTEEQLLEQTRGGSLPGQVGGGGRSLLDVDSGNNWLNGLGGLLGEGQTGSQPPGPSIGQPNVGSRMNDLVQQLLQQPQRQPALSQGQLQLAAAGNAVGRLAGMRDRKVGIGELLGALGGGMTQGAAAFDQQQRADRADQFQELGAMGKIQQYQRGEATAARQMEAANAYAAQIEGINPALAAALRNNPSLMDEVAKAQAGQTFQKDEPTAAMRNAQAMGLRPGSPEYNRFIQQAGLPASTQVSVGAQERAEDKAYGEELVKDYATVRDTANAGRQSLQAIEIARNIPVTTGAIEPLRAKVGALAQSFGISPEALRGFGLDQATTAEAFTGVMQNLVLSRMQAQKGPQTQQDAQRIESTVASLGNTPEASDFLLRTGQAMARRDVEKHNFYEQYRASKGSLNGVQQAWDSELNGRPLLGVNPNSRLPVFYDEFVPAFLQANPGATKADALTMWKTKYGQ